MVLIFLFYSQLSVRLARHLVPVFVGNDSVREWTVKLSSEHFVREREPVKFTKPLVFIHLDPTQLWRGNCPYLS